MWEEMEDVQMVEFRSFDQRGFTYSSVCSSNIYFRLGIYRARLSTLPFGVNHGNRKIHLYTAIYVSVEKKRCGVMWLSFLSYTKSINNVSRILEFPPENEHARRLWRRRNSLPCCCGWIWRVRKTVAILRSFFVFLYTFFLSRSIDASLLLSCWLHSSWFSQTNVTGRCGRRR